MIQMRNRKLTIDDTLEFLLDRGIISEKISGTGYIYDYHEDSFRYWSKNEAIGELSRYLGYGIRSKAGRRAIDSCTEEYCIEWPRVYRHWEEEVATKLDIMSEASGVDLDQIDHKTYHQLSAYHNMLKKKVPDETKFREAFRQYVLRKLSEKKDLRFGAKKQISVSQTSIDNNIKGYTECSSSGKPNLTAMNQF